MAEDVSRQERRRQERKKKKEEQKRQQQVRQRKKQFLTYTGIFAILVILFAGGYALVQNAEVKTEDTGDSTVLSNMSKDELLSYNLQNHANAARHIHPQLHIEILGSERPIPGQVGIGPNSMRVVHTHDNSGTIHVEPPVPADVTLGNFFTIWNRTFNSTCIFEYCTNATHKLTMHVNGEQSDAYQDLVLADNQRITLRYEQKDG